MLEGEKYQNDKYKIKILDNIFLNVHFSVTIAYKVAKFRLLIPHIHSEGTVSQIVYLCLSFNIN